MRQNFKTLAILGSSGSGKTALSLEIAREFSCVILSLDSLSVYKEINIASAKPSLQERGEIVHFGIDVLSPSQRQNVQNFIVEFKRAQEFCAQNHKHLLIVGGTSFYLKSLLCGISPMPKRKSTTQRNIQSLGGLAEQYAFLCKIDSVYARRLQAKDSYRIMRALEIYFDTQCVPSAYFKENPPESILKDCAIFDIVFDRELLRQKIAMRTKGMLEQGLIVEVERLVECYGEAHQWAKSIGIKEVLAFKRGELNLHQLESLITTHTAQLAKRQRTFNKTQFLPHFCGEYLEVKEAIRQKLLD